MRLGHSTHKLPLVRPHDTRIRQVLIENLPNQALSRLARVMSHLLPRPSKRSLRRSISHSKDHSLRDSSALRGRCDPICEFGDDAEVELLLCLLRHGEA